MWAVAAAVGTGLVLGYLQGSNVSIERKEKGLYAKRNATALVAFGAGLIVTQLAGLLNRTGIIAVGLALSFLSAAMLAGVMAGRRPVLAEARKAVATAVLATLIGGALLATALPPQRGDAQDDDPIVDISCGSLTPGERCAGHEKLLDLVDWSAVQFNGGLFWSLGKPPATIEVPRGFDAPPAPVTRTIEWQNGVPVLDNALVKSFQLTETYTFELTSEGVCCGVLYSGTGTETDIARVPVEEYDPNVVYTRTDQPGLGEETETHVAEGRLHDLAVLGNGRAGELVGLGGGTAGLPFSEQKDLNQVSVTERCGRYLASSVLNMNHNGEFTTLLLNGEPQSEGRADTVAFSYAATSCEIPGFTYDAAIAELPPVQAPPRSQGCPVRQQLVPALAEGGYEVTDTLTVAELFTAPNEELCSAGGLISPMNFGSGVKGGTRSEFMFQYSIPETQTVWGDDSALSGLNPAIIAPEDRCEVDEQGRPLRLEGDARCNLMTMHQLDDGWVHISYDNQHIDGPNTTLRVSLPWGAYRYQCHHCEPDDPEIERFLGQFHDFSTDWEPPASGTEIIPDNPVFNDEILAEQAEEAELEGLGAEAAELGIDPELAELFIDDDADADTRAAALAALVGLIGSLGLAGTALAEAGISPTEMAESFRSGGRQGVDDLIDDEWAELQAELNAVDEVAEPPPTPSTARVRGWDPIRNVFRDMSPAEYDRMQGLDRQQRRGARQRRDRTTLAEIRADRARVDRLTEHLERRDALEARLDAAQAESNRWNDPDYVNQVIVDDAFDGMLRDVEGLPDELRDLAEAINETMNDPETWTILRETLSGTVYDAAGMLSPIEFGDGRQHLTDSTRAAGHFGAAMAQAFAEDPIGFVWQMSPLADVSDSLDPDRTLGERLGSLGMVLGELFPAMGGASAMRDAANLAEAANDVQRTASAAHDIERAADAVEAARNIDRATGTLEASADVNRAGGVARDLDRGTDAIGTATDTQRSAALTSSAQDAQTAGRRTTVADNVDDQIARNRAALGDDLGSAEEQARRTSWEARRREGAGKVDDFADEATRSVDLETESIEEINRRQREAALQVHTDKQALQDMKNQPVEVQQAFVNQMREVYDETDAAVLDWATGFVDDLDSGPLRDVRITGDLQLDRVEGGRHIFVDGAAPPATRSTCSSRPTPGPVRSASAPTVTSPCTCVRPVRTVRRSPCRAPRSDVPTTMRSTTRSAATTRWIVSGSDARPPTTSAPTGMRAGWRRTIRYGCRTHPTSLASAMPMSPHSASIRRSPTTSTPRRTAG